MQGFKVKTIDPESPEYNPHKPLADLRDFLINTCVQSMSEAYRAGGPRTRVYDVCGRSSRYDKATEKVVICVDGGYPADEGNIGAKGVVFNQNVTAPRDSPVLLSNADWYFTIEQLCTMFSGKGGMIVSRDFKTGAQGKNTFPGEFISLSNAGVCHKLPGSRVYNHPCHLWEDEGCLCTKGIHLHYRTQRTHHNIIVISITPTLACHGRNNCLRTLGAGVGGPFSSTIEEGIPVFTENATGTSVPATTVMSVVSSLGPGQPRQAYLTAFSAALYGKGTEIAKVEAYVDAALWYNGLMAATDCGKYEKWRHMYVKLYNSAIPWVPLPTFLRSKVAIALIPEIAPDHGMKYAAMAWGRSPAWSSVVSTSAAGREPASTSAGGAARPDECADELVAQGDTATEERAIEPKVPIDASGGGPGGNASASSGRGEHTKKPRRKRSLGDVRKEIPKRDTSSDAGSNGKVKDAATKEKGGLKGVSKGGANGPPKKHLPAPIRLPSNCRAVDNGHGENVEAPPVVRQGANSRHERRAPKSAPVQSGTGNGLLKVRHDRKKLPHAAVRPRPVHPKPPVVAPGGVGATGP